MVKKLINKLSEVSIKVKEYFIYNPVQEAIQEIKVREGYENVPELLKRAERIRSYSTNNDS